jgi:DnaJ homolog subfamily C member 19
MVKLLWLLAIAAFACKYLTRRWPWELLSLAARTPELKQARNLLGLSSTANRIEILEAHKALVAVIHPDRGGTNEQVHEANAARDLLLAHLPKSIAE